MTLSVSIRHPLAHFALDLAFDAGPGVTAIFGRSGAGKTTLVNAVAGMLRPAEGRIELNGEVLSEGRHFVPPHKRRIGYVFQDGRLFPHLTVRQNLLYGRWFSGGGADVGRIVDMLGLAPLMDRRPARLSGGEKQRVAIGRALLCAPRLLLLDEPLAALDTARKAEILPYLERLHEEGLPILYVSHSVAEVMRLAARVILLDAGRIVGSGAPADLLSDPASGLSGSESGALIPAHVAAREADGLARFDTAAGPVFLPTDQPVGAAAVIRIHAQDVMIALFPPAGISALNVLPAVVEQTIPRGHETLVRLRLGPEALLARITTRSAAALGLAPGLTCHAILKTVAIADYSVSEGVTTGVFSERSR
ncbi:molybdenum ABC transporter ATP-binding protein [Cereibacter sp. SYSU M97828]|nr:molybdenum ABC transporter ATP-binding protein [Cereibacter flavus]